MKNSGAADHFTFCVEKLSFTGEPIDSDTAAWTKATFGGDVCSMYGTTEIGVILADYPGAADHKVKPGSLGRPIPGIELAVHDPNRQNCPTGQIGEIMMKRRNGWFPTKDLGWIDEDGYFYHGGRADDVIISAGYTMSAVEIEDVLLKHPDVDETFSPCSIVIWGIRAETFREAGKGSAVARSRTSSIPIISQLSARGYHVIHTSRVVTG